MNAPEGPIRALALFFHAWCFLWVVVPLQGVLSRRALRVSDTSRTQADTAVSLPPAALAAEVRAVDRAVRYHLLPVRCLPRSLVLRALLARRGVPAALRIGVRREGDQLAAHAWVEVGGLPLGEPLSALSQFQPLEAAR